jgi:membrane associated rhomboid family serine protease
VLEIGVNNIPPITLGVLILCSVLHFDFIGIISPDVHQVCLIPSLLWSGRDWYRLLTAAVYHNDDMHLYYNMSSWLYKGRFLEKRIGTIRFLVMTVEFAIVTNLLFLVASYVMAHYFGNFNNMNACALGLSGVLFAFKVLMTAYATGPQFVMGIPVPSKYVYWAELLLIQMINPHVSFLGHLCGIVAGLLYVKGPLKPVVEVPTRILEDIVMGGNHVPAPNPRRFVEYQGPLNNGNNNNGFFFGNAAQVQNNNFYQPQGPAVANNYNNYDNGNNNNYGQIPGETPAQRAARLRNLGNY